MASLLAAEDSVDAVPLPSKSRKGKKKAKGGGSPSQSLASVEEFKFSGSRAELVRVVKNEKGRALVAVQDLAPGTLIFSERPFTLIAHSPAQICVCCGSIGQVPTQVEVSFSLFPKYINNYDIVCSASCEREWAVINDKQASALAEIPSVSTACRCDKDLLRMVIQMLYRCAFESLSSVPTSETGSSCADHYFSDDGETIRSTPAGLLALECHNGKHSAAWEESIRRALEELSDKFPSEIGQYCTEKLGRSVVDVACGFAASINVNAYGILSLTLPYAPIGFGIFPIAGLCINHDCQPNCAYSYNPTNRSLEYRTLSSVPAHSEITVSYINSFVGFQTRSNRLWSTRFFRCQCKRCRSSTALLLGGSTRDTCSSSVTNSPLTESDLVDIMLDGLLCQRCGSKGVICARNVSDSAVEPIFNCLVCAFEAPSISAAACLDQSRLEWTACKKLISDGIDDEQAVTQLEQWLARWDPLYSSTGEFVTAIEPTDGLADPNPSNSKAMEKLTAIELLRIRRLKLSGTAAQAVPHQYLKLHPNNSLVIEAVLELGSRRFSLLQHRGVIDVSSIDFTRANRAFERAYGCFKKMFSQNDPEIANIASQWLNYLTAMRAGLASSRKAMDLEERRRILLVEIVEIRKISLGAAHPLTIESILIAESTA